MPINNWKKCFEKFFSEVPFEKRSSTRLEWKQKHEQVVTFYYGLNGGDQQTISQVGKLFCFDDGAVKQILAQARVMCNRYYEAKQKQEAILQRRFLLAQEIREKVLRG